jgi:hypothetical protein
MAATHLIVTNGALLVGAFTRSVALINIFS